MAKLELNAAAFVEEKKAISPELLRSMISQWHSIDRQRKELIAQENELRIAIVKAIMTGDPEGDLTGAEKKDFDLNDELYVTARSCVTTKADVDAIEELADAGELSAAEMACLKFKTEFHETSYKKLPAENKISQFVMTQPAMPKLELKERK